MLAGENVLCIHAPVLVLRLGTGFGHESQDLHRGEYGCSEPTGPAGPALDDLSLRVGTGTGAVTQAVARDLGLHRPGLLQAVSGRELGAVIKSDAGNNDLLDHPEINNAYKSDPMVGITSSVAPGGLPSGRRGSPWRSPVGSRSCGSHLARREV